MKRKICKVLKIIGIVLLLFIVVSMIRPTWTPAIKGDNSVSELRKVNIGDSELEIMIRGNDKDNPVVIFVHGGPCCSEIPYVRKYQEELEKDFTIVHYDQRGSGKSYGFAARQIDDNADYLYGFLFGTEYNLLDAIRFYTASIKYQDNLIVEATNNPITELVTEINVPVYFVMGKYDGMTSPESAKKYLDNITGEGTKEIVLFEESAHYPQFEEEQEFHEWMKDTFK